MRPGHSEGVEALGDFRRHPMTVLLWVMLAGSVGVAMRYGLDVLITSRSGAGFPWSTLTVNVVGALALGVLVGVMAGVPVGASTLRPALAIGLLGGFTTFSAFALDAVTLLEDGTLLRAAVYVGATNVLGIGAMFAGLASGRAISM